jgi:hypothetical protein
VKSRSPNHSGVNESKEMHGEILEARRQVLRENLREGFEIFPKFKPRRGKPMVTVVVICGRGLCVWVE